jgi:hypothetical protein
MSSSAGREHSKELSIENLHKIMDFMRRSKISSFRMIGGEPTQHTRFKEVYEIVTKENFTVLIFSNGVIGKDTVDFLSGQKNLTAILLNIRSPQEYKKKDWEKIMYTLSRLGSRIFLSFRIYRLDFDPRFLFDLIDKYQLVRELNWAIACPSLISRNDYLPLEDHEKAVERMVEYSKECKTRAIRWFSDSGFIWCAFAGGKYERLKENVGFEPEANCIPAIEVTPDLRVIRCFGMASKSRKGLLITDFNNVGEAEDYFSKKSRPFKRIGGLDKCFTCEHIISQKCGGGCMVHILKKFPNYKELPVIF